MAGLRHNGSIRGKLIRIIVVTCCVAVLAACAVFGAYDVTITRQSQLQALKTVAAITGNNSTAALAFRDSKAGKSILSSLRGDPHIIHAALYTSDGKLLAIYDGGSLHDTFTPPKPEADSVAIATGGHIRTFFAVNLNSKPVGTIYIESTTARLAQREKGLAIMVGASLAVSLLVAVLFGSRLQEGISSSILELARTAFTVAVEKNYSVRATVTGSDEITFLYEQFNGMLEGIQKRDNELLRARAELEQRVAERTAYLNALIETSPLGIITTDGSGRVQICNRAFGQLFQLSREEVTAQELDNLIVPPELTVEATKFSRRSKAGESLRAITRRRRKDGTLIDVEVYGMPLIVGGEQVGNLVLYHDITQSKQTEKALQRAKEAAESANRAKSEFLANMSHEIRTPMNGIIGMTQLALDAQLNPKVREYLELVKASAESLLDLLNDILDYSKIEAGKIEFEAAPFALRDSLGQTMKMLEHAAHRKGLELAWKVASEIPDWLVGDCGRVRQVMMNLVGNSIKFTERGEVAVSADLQKRGDGFADIHFAVRDTGIGIAPEKQKLIFAAFTQADASMTRKYGGTGLGLAIVQRLVSMMNGNVWVESAPRQGSTFHFTIRFGLPPESLTSPANASPFMLQNLPVLIVDDNETNRIILFETCKHQGMAPQSAANAQQAMEALRRNRSKGKPFQFAIIDAHMRETDGFALAEQIRQDMGFSALSIIMLSSAPSSRDVARAQQAGISAILTKPLQTSELLNRILLGVKKSKAQAGHSLCGQPARQRGLRILLAEDNAVNRQLATKILEKQGHNVIVATNGREALDLLRKEKVDLALMDVQMPEMDGLEAIQCIRENEKRSGGRLPIISVTAHVMKGDREKCIQAGADDYVSKPLQASDLFSAIERCCPDAPCSVDENKMLERCQGDRQLLAEIIRLFESEAEERLEETARAIERADAETIARAAHTLKGSIVNFTDKDAYIAAQKLERDARSGNLTEVGSDFAKLQSAVRLLRLELRKYRDVENNQAIPAIAELELIEEKN